ncbi:MAG: RNA polymerase subunit sigma-70, partial [Proteobacteria bacterium]|nr:RNA polymerase subunit sigma-70 [Pseudomonadota bacterium]
MQDIDKSKLASNVNRLGHLNIPGGGQVVVHGKYAYIGHMDPPYGTTILDISDPADPKIVSQVTLPDNYSHTHKVRVVGDLMFTNYEQFNRHFLRKGDALPDAREKLETSLGRAPNDEELAAEVGGVKASDIAVLDEARERGYHEGGFRIYDISDRASPKQLCHKKTHGFGVHRFDVDENYAYMSTEMEGYIGNILVVYDYSD